MSADHVTLERGLWWGTVGTPGHTFVLADLLNPGQRVHLHQCIWDADHVHHVHDALKARTHAEVTQERPPPRAGSTRDTTGCARHAPGRSAPCRWAAGPSASQNNPEASSGRYPSPLASCSQPPLMNGAHSRSEQRPGGGGALTVRIPCQSPTSFLKSNTFTIVSAARVKKERFSLMKEAQNERQRKSGVMLSRERSWKTSFYRVFAETLQPPNPDVKAG